MSSLACRGFLLGEFKVGMDFVYARSMPSWWEISCWIFWHEDCKGGGYAREMKNTENGYIPHTILYSNYKLNTPKE